MKISQTLAIRFAIKFFILFSTIFLSFFSITLPANALLELELTQGVDTRIPISVFSFAGQNDESDISSVIRRDLAFSGYFKIIPTDGNPSSSAQLNFSSWRSRNVDNLVIGNIANALTNSKVNFQLLDVLTKRPLLSEQYSTPAQNLRRLAHHISDAIYQKLTGIRGIFSTRIAYVLVQRHSYRNVRYTLEVADADGYQPKPILVSHQPILSPSWSPDGRKLAYVSFEQRRPQIYVTDVATGSRTLVTSFSGINGAPAWSPDGRQLAIVLSKSGRPKIYVINLASKQLRQVTTGMGIDTEPSWAPDGRSILFTSDRGGSPQIYQVDLGNDRVQRLTFQGDYNARASYTPNGKQIVMLHREGGTFSIAAMDRHSEHFQVLSRAGLDESPSVSPNGKMILFATTYGGRGVLGVVSIDGRVQLRYPSRDGDVREPAWSPFLS